MSTMAFDMGLRRVGGLALLLAIAATFVALTLHPPHDFGIDAGVLDDVRRNRDAWIAAHLLFLGATILLITAFLALASVVGETRPRLAAVALGSGLAGAVGQMGFLGIDFVMWQMAAPEADLAQMTAVLERLETSMAIGAPLNGLLALFGIGLVLLLSGLVRCAAMSPLLAGSVLAGSGLALAFSDGVLAFAGIILAVPGLVWLGWRLLTPEFE